MRPAIAMAVLLFALAGCGSRTATITSADSCVAPTLSAPREVHPDEIVDVSGEWFFASCNDTVDNGRQPAPRKPMEGLAVTVVEGSKSWVLATNVAARGAHAQVHVKVTMPPDMSRGAAVISLGGEAEAQLVVVAAPTTRTSTRSAPVR